MLPARPVAAWRPVPCRVFRGPGRVPHVGCPSPAELCVATTKGIGMKRIEPACKIAKSQPRFSPAADRDALHFAQPAPLLLNPGGIADGSRWLSVFCDTTGLSKGKIAPRQGCQTLCRKFLAPLPGCNSKPPQPVVSQRTLNHRLPSAIPPGLSRRRPSAKMAQASLPATLLLLATLAIGQTPHFRYERALLPSAGANRISPDVALMSGASSDLRDLRFYDASGKEVPYIQISPTDPQPHWISGAILQVASTKVTSGFEVD